MVSPSIAIVIPARLDSVRLPRKVLLNIHGLPMIEHVRRRALMNSYSLPVYVASGDPEILDSVRSYSGSVIQTDKDHPNGLSRVHEAAKVMRQTHIIVLQGDEILILPEQIDSMIKSIYDNLQVDFWNQVSPLSQPEEIHDLSVVKCAQSQTGNILMFFRRSPLTSLEAVQISQLKKVCGLFAVTRKALNEYFSWSSTPMQEAESIEQMRYLEHGKTIMASETSFNNPSINLPSDVIRIMETLMTSKLQSSILAKVVRFDRK
jgi:3-deoxy-manno-octulosonate cytidylyltransferase (CMP-KDO synthetase)